MQELTRMNMCSLLLCLLLVGWFHHCRGQEEAAGEADSPSSSSSSLSSPQVSAPMEPKEQEALFAAIQGFVGKWWNGSDLYPDPCGWTPIQGVSCDIFNGYWYVTTLNIGPVMENSLQCSNQARFTQHLFQLTHLRTLSFFNCFIVSPTRIPASGTTWNMLSNSLETLEFRSNPGLIGPVPSTLGNLERLKSLILLQNGLAGELPSEIGNLVKLKQLVLSSNRLCGQIPEAFGTLRELLILDASRNSLTGSLPSSFGGLVSLLKLDLSNNQIEGKLPDEMKNLQNLTLLDLRNNKISGGLVPRVVESMASLKELVISGNPIVGDIEEIQWRNLQKLEILDLSHMGLIGKIPEKITGMKRLRFLGLNDNNLSGSLSPKLAEMEGLGALYLQNNNFTGVMGFPWRFYGRMGRRFAAWNNPNLCYLEEPEPIPPPELAAAMAGRSTYNGRPPYGVKRCRL